MCPIVPRSRAASNDQIPLWPYACALAKRRLSLASTSSIYDQLSGDLVLTKDALCQLDYTTPAAFRARPSKSAGPTCRHTHSCQSSLASPTGSGETSEIWSGRRGSNPRPTAWKAVTLAELLPPSRRSPPVARRFGEASPRAPLCTSLTRHPRAVRAPVLYFNRHRGRRAKRGAAAKPPLSRRRANRHALRGSAARPPLPLPPDKNREAMLPPPTASSNPPFLSLAREPAGRLVGRRRVRTSVARRRQVYSLLRLTALPPPRNTSTSAVRSRARPLSASVSSETVGHGPLAHLCGVACRAPFPETAHSRRSPFIGAGGGIEPPTC